MGDFNERYLTTEQKKALEGLTYVEGVNKPPLQRAYKLGAIVFVAISAIAIFRFSWIVFALAAFFATCISVFAYVLAFPRFCPRCEKEMDEFNLDGSSRRYRTGWYAYKCSACRLYGDVHSKGGDS